MKITDNTMNGIQAGNLSSAKGKDKLGGLSKNDLMIDGGGSLAGDSAKVNLSEKAKDIKKAFELAKNSAPEVDEDKVAKFRSLIDSGNYKVDAEQVAGRMVDEHLFTDTE